MELTVITGTPYHVSHGSYARIDTYRDERYRVWCVGSKDQSPQHQAYPVGYASCCVSCWYGHGHTTELHAQQVALASQRQA